MSFDFELDETKRIVLSRARGELTDRDLLSHLQRIAHAFECGTLDSTWGHIADFSEVNNLDRVTPQAVRQMAELNPWPRESPRVLVVPSDLEYGFARMYQMLGEPKTESLVLVRSRLEANEHIENARRDHTEAT